MAPDPGSDVASYYSKWLRDAGLSRWRADAEPDEGVGLEGLYRLVDGAAESYWERGVTGASFQEFSPGTAEEVLEIHRFSFRNADAAARYLDETCREDGGVLASGKAAVSCCRFSGGPLNRALVRRESAVYDLQVYGIPAGPADPVTRLVETFGASGCRLGGGP